MVRSGRLKEVTQERCTGDYWNLGDFHAGQLANLYVGAESFLILLTALNLSLAIATQSGPTTRHRVVLVMLASEHLRE